MSSSTVPSTPSGPSGSSRTAPRLGVGETLRVALGVLAPTVAQGAIARRPRAMGLAERFDLDGAGGADRPGSAPPPR